MHWPTRVLRAARIGIPVALLGIGVMLLVGCIYIPSTYQYQRNGMRRPESLIGRGKAIEIGRTTLVDALIAIASLKPSQTDAIDDPAPNAYGPSHLAWFGAASASPDTRAVAITYSLRKGNIVWPLCFWSFPETEPRVLVLTADDDGIVRDAQTLTTFPVSWRRRNTTGPNPFARIFNEQERQRLAGAGIIWSDVQYEQMQEYERRNAEHEAQRQAMSAKQRAAATNSSTELPRP